MVKMVQEIDETVKVSQAAKIAGVDRRTILRWVDKGYIKAVKYPSGHHRIIKENLEQFLSKYLSRKKISYKIFVIDDMPVMLEVMREMLESLNLPIEVTTCENELDALLKMGENKPDLIFIDYRLKNVDGITISRKIRENQTLKDVPIILVSGVIHDISQDELGFQAFLRKPFQQKDIEGVLKDCLAFN